VTAVLLDFLSKALDIGAASIDVREPFSDYGLDSILGVGFVKNINDALGLSLNTAIIYDYTSVERLAAHLVEAHTELSPPLSLSPSLLLSFPPSVLQAPAAIAVIGMSGQFPDANSVETFWQNLIQGKNGVHELPPHYLDQEQYFSPEPQAGKTYCKWGGILEERAYFDPLFFNISPWEAESMSPHQRLVLQESWKSLEDAGYNPKDLADTRVGIFVGAEPTGFVHQTFTGSSDAIVASRLSYHLNLKGPAMVVNTGCSSSAVAIHLACESLRTGESSLALAGGVFAAIGEGMLIGLAQTDMLSPSGTCHTFDHAADGTVFSEGVGMVVLKRLEDAVAAGDPIYGVIEASGINQDGASNGITAPNGLAQEQLILDVYRRFGIDPERISYVEAHGTGTKLGDPVEANALVRAFRCFTDKRNFCAVGSAKANIGHTGASAGVIGLIKILLCLKHRQLPGLLYFEALNPLIEFEGSPFYINTEPVAWRSADGRPLMAALNSFGHSGTNVHLVVREFVAEPREPSASAPELVPLSARTEEALTAYTATLQSFLEARGPNASLCLADVAHTFQVGRAAMQERVVFLVQDIPDLVAQLAAFRRGDLGRCWRGSVAPGAPDRKHLLPSDEDTRELVAMWVAKGQLHKVAELWCEGFSIDWSLLAPAGPRRRVHLPVYPFAKEVYWPERARIAVAVDGGGARGVLHPLLHENTSDLAAQRFSSRFSGGEFFLADHRVRGRRTLPAVAYLEMARAAVSRATAAWTASEHEAPGLLLKDIAWMRPITVDGSNLDVHIRLLPEQNGQIRFEIYTDAGSHDEAPVIHGQGTALLAEPQPKPDLDLPRLHAECDRASLDADQCYLAFNRMGLDYGPAFQAIESVYVGESNVLAKLRLPACVPQAGTGGLVLHPSIMDAALQATLGLSFLGGPTAACGGNLKTAMPFALGELEIFGPCTASMWALIRYAEGSHAGDKVEKIDLDLCDEQGKVLLRLRKFSVRTLESEAVAETVPVGNILLAPIWNPVGPEPGVMRPELSARVLVIGGSGEPQQAIRELYPEARDLVLRHEVTEIAAQLDALGIVDHIVWIAPDQPSTSPHEPPPTWQGHMPYAALIAAQETGVLQLFKLVKALLSRDYGARELGWTVITTGALAVRRQDPVCATHAGIHGLVGSMAKEYPHWAVRLLDLEVAAPWPVRELFALPPDPRGDAWAHRRGEWVRQELLPVREWPLDTSNLYRTGGVYVVIGGAGGIGKAWSRFIVREHNAHIVWIGRRAEDDTIRADLDTLGEIGPRPLYIQADARDRASLQAAYERVKSIYGHIHGVVHSAIVLLDQTLAKMDEERFRAGLSAKADVSVRLAQVFANEPLDFVLFFSAVQAFLKAAGQSNYAAGCTFQDAFAHQLRQTWACPVKIINWGYWGSIGIVKDAFYRERMAAAGIGSIEPEDGMAALHALLNGPLDQLALVKTLTPEAVQAMQPVNLRAWLTVYPHTAPGEQEALRAHLPDHYQERGAHQNFAGSISDERLREKSTILLKTLVAETLNMSPRQIESGVPLEAYGIDSILVIRLTNAFRKVFDQVSSTLFFEVQTIEALVDHFMATRRETLIQVLGLEAPRPGITDVEARAAATTAANDRPTPVQRWRGSNAARRFAQSGVQARDARSFGMVPTSGRAIFAVQDIAVIGLSGRYPGARDVGEFWQRLRAGTNCVAEIPRDRWDWRKFYDAEKGRPGTSYTRWGGFLDDVDKFDPLFFHISPREAESMDPQERLFLETVYASIEDAGYTPATLCTSRKVGVFAGVMHGTYSAQPSHWSIANRVSYLLDFHGPSMAVNSACSSSLTAIHLALESLYAGSSDCAIAGGVNLILNPIQHLTLASMSVLSANGACCVFGAGADGLVAGEGVGAIVLKPLDKAIADGDHIYGVLKGSMVNAGGKTNGYTVPNPKAQAQLIMDALHRAGVHAQTLSYIEAHGTGTVLGDPIEIAGLTQAFERHTQMKQFCAIGSVKSNIGHGESAAGIAGLTKVLLQMQHGELVPSLHAEVTNPHIDFSQTPFVLQRGLTPWKRPVLVIEGDGEREFPRIAGISSFGAGGANAHLVVEEYRAPEPVATEPEAPCLIVLSARTEDRLTQVATDLHRALYDGAVTRDLAAIAYTLQVGRQAMDERLAFIAGSLDELKAGLQAFLRHEEPPGMTLYRGQVKPHKETLALFTADEDMAATIDAWIAKGKYEKLLELWVKGLNVDWHKLYGASGPQHESPRRTSLPTYPFARERYWLEGLDMEPVESNTSAQDPAALPHPLLHEKASDVADGTAAAETFMLVPVWNAVPGEERSDAPSPDNGVLIAGGTEHQRAVLRRLYPEASVLELHAGDEIEAIAARLDALEPIRHILVLAPEYIFVSPADETLIGAQERGVLLVFRLIKALLARDHGGHDLHWTLVTTRAQAVHGRDPINPAHAALHGLAGSMAKEYPHWRTRLIDLESAADWGGPDGPASVIHQMLRLPTDSAGNAWAHRGGEWFRQELIPVRDLAAEGQIYRAGGVYVVIGGAGGLGALWSRFMLEKYGAHIIWIGRRPKDAGIQAKLDDLARLGPPPVYLSADATDRQALQRAYAEIKRRYPRIHGVIHAAIVLQDKGLAGMDETRFRAGLAAKVEVCVRLAQVFEQEELDFTLFFSSLESFAKSPGQSNYAAGCTFKDAFARAMARHWRGRVKVMNWGYWGHIGIVAAAHYQERMQQAGIASIEPEEGMAALDALLNGPVDQLALMKVIASLPSPLARGSG